MNNKTLIKICIVSIAVFSACDTFTQKKYEFYYYPLRNVYYNVYDHNFFYSLDGGATWDSLHQPITKDPSTLGNRQIIYSAIPNIWVNNQAHVQQYSGKVFTLATSDSTYAQQNLIEERKLPRKINPVTENLPPPKPEKKPGFFKRLFGKRNN